MTKAAPYCPSCDLPYSHHDGLIKTCADKKALEKRLQSLCLLEETTLSHNDVFITLELPTPAAAQLLWLALRGIKRELCETD